MAQVILQPSGSPDARQHYSDTITRPVSLAVIAQHVPAADVAILQTLFPEGVAPTWGVVPGDNEGNRKKWERVENGDILLFAGSGAVRANGVVVHKLHSVALATQLWGRDEDGETWEYVYFIDQVEDCNIPYQEFNAAAGYKVNNVIQGFQVLDGEKSARILAALDLTKDGSVGGTAKDFAASTALATEGELDVAGQVLLRKEQGYLRRMLFGRRDRGACALCGREMPIDLLVAAHIKKRSLCSTAEKRDFANNVLPMCRMGCDDLFEKGYLLVRKATVHGNPVRLQRATSPVQTYIKSLDGRTVVAWQQGMEAYFVAHCAHLGLEG